MREREREKKGERGRKGDREGGKGWREALLPLAILIIPSFWGRARGQTTMLCRAGSEWLGRLPVRLRGLTKISRNLSRSRSCREQQRIRRDQGWANKCAWKGSKVSQVAHVFTLPFTRRFPCRSRTMYLYGQASVFLAVGVGSGIVILAIRIPK